MIEHSRVAQGYGGGASSQAFTGQISSQVPDGPNKIFAGGIPYSLGENEVKELLGSFGQLRAFHLVKERESNTSKGSADTHADARQWPGEIGESTSRHARADIFLFFLSLSLSCVHF